MKTEKEQKMTFSENMVPGVHVRNVDARRQQRFEATLRDEAVRCGIDPTTEELTLDGKLLTFRTAQGAVTRRISLRRWNKDTIAIEITAAMAGMGRDIQAVRLLGRDVVAGNLLVDEMSARTFFRMGGTASSIRAALIENGRRDPLEVEIALDREDGTEITLGFQEGGHGPGSFMMTSFLIPGVASMRAAHDGFVIRPAQRLTASQNEAIGRGGGLARILGHEIFDIFPFAVASIDTGTGAIRALRRTEHRLARIEPRHPRLDSTTGIDSHYSELDNIEREEREADAARASGPERQDGARSAMERAAKRAFLEATELGGDPWGNVVAAVLAASAEKPRQSPSERQDWRSVKVEHLDLDRRSRNCALSTSARTVGDLDAMTDGELIRIPNLGRKSLDEIRAAIAALQTRP